MIKNEFLSQNGQKNLLSQKRKRDSNLEENINIETIYEEIPINKINLENSKNIKYEKNAILIEDFFTNKYGQTKINENCAICKMNEFSPNELLFFEKEINLYYYLKYLFNLNKNKLIISNEIFFGNKNELNKCNEFDFLSKIKFSCPKIICKSCFSKIINEKEIIQNIIRIFNDNIINSINISNNYYSSNELNLINMEIKNNNFKNQNFVEKNTTINSSLDKSNENLVRNDNNYKNKFTFINNKLDLKNDFNSSNYISNLNDGGNYSNKTNNNNNNYINYNNKYNINFNDIVYKNKININSNNIEEKNNSSNNDSVNEPMIIQEKNKIKIKVDSSDENNQNELLNINTHDLIKNNIINEKNKISESIFIKYLYCDKFHELSLCLIELKNKISEIIKLFKQLKKKYDFIFNYYPYLFDIILYLKKSFFLLNFVATSEIVNNLALSHHYIFQRINIISKIINFLENRQNLSLTEINDIKNLKLNIENIYGQAEQNNKEFRYSMNKFMEILNIFPFINKRNGNI